MVGIYADEGITGTKTNKRDEFLRMIDDCMNGLIDIVITKSVSRFSRNLVNTLSYTRMLKSKGVTVLPEILALWGTNLVTDIESKKN